MGYRTMIFLAACLVASVAAAQSVPTPTGEGSDSWGKPAAASSSVSYRTQELPASKPSPSHFKFKDSERARPGDRPPPSAMDKAAVMGTPRPWQNGQPPVDCASSPHSAACQH